MPGTGFDDFDAGGERVAGLPPWVGNVLAAEVQRELERGAVVSEAPQHRQVGAVHGQDEVRPLHQAGGGLLQLPVRVVLEDVVGAARADMQVITTQMRGSAVNSQPSVCASFTVVLGCADRPADLGA